MMLFTRVERWPIAGGFTISRGTKTEAEVVVAELTDGTATGRGECVPYARYGESVRSVEAAIEAVRSAVQDDISPGELALLMPPGAARNALDCAVWDLAAKRANTRVHELLNWPPPVSVTTAYTLSLGTPELMEAAAEAAASRPLLKVKLGSGNDPARIAAVRRGAPRARLIVDANEGWSEANLAENLAACADAGVVLIEQPLPAGADEILRRINRQVPVCADESLHDRASLPHLVGKYDAINIKLDKAGGLTEALALMQDAEQAGFAIMVGCMVATSLAMAPALLVAQRAAFVDLDGPLLLAHDRPEGLRYQGSVIEPASPALWG